MGAAGSLLLSIGVPLAGGVAGAFISQKDVATWYKTIKKPRWTPPSWVFGPVWTALYIAQGTAAWFVWRKRGGRHGVALPLSLYGAQLALNLIWNPLFFKTHKTDLATADAAAILGLATAATATMARVSSPAIQLPLMVPYLVWLAYATALSATICIKNPSERLLKTRRQRKAEAAKRKAAGLVTEATGAVKDAVAAVSAAQTAVSAAGSKAVSHASAAKEAVVAPVMAAKDAIAAPVKAVGEAVGAAASSVAEKVGGMVSSAASGAAARAKEAEEEVEAKVAAGEVPLAPVASAIKQEVKAAEPSGPGALGLPSQPVTEAEEVLKSTEEAAGGAGTGGRSLTAAIQEELRTAS